MTARKVNIMPMAGDGVRLKEAGFYEPKPLIEIGGKPMFIKSAECMPDADHWIFIVKKSLLENHNLENIIMNKFKNYTIIPVEKTTEGQASSCYLAKKILKNKDSVFINSCDSYIKFSHNEFDYNKQKCDVIVFTTKCDELHKKKPNSYGWVSHDEKGSIQISCKKPFNKTFQLQNPIVGSFYYNKAKYFLESLEILFNKKYKINNEYYLDMSIQECINLGLKVLEVKSDKYIDFGNSKNLKD